MTPHVSPSHRRARHWWIALSISGFLLGLWSAPAQARLPDPALRVGRWGLSGAVVGAAAGTVMWPISGQARTVFVGASVGLYLGIAAGLYGEWERSEQEAEVEFYSERGAQALGPAPPWFSWKIRF